MTAKEILFKKVLCSAYLAKVSDGVCIMHIKPEYAEDRQEHFMLCRGHDDGGEGTDEEESPCEGAYDLEKTYYERREMEFYGICVGTKKVKTEGYLGVDVGYSGPSCEEYYYVFKHPKTIVECAIVYFANNQKRFVPLDAIEIAKEETA